MLRILEMVEKSKSEGYNETFAEAKVSQDLILSMISKSNLKGNITVKGGVVMRGISRDARRATQDIDLDFIRYSLSDDAIREFIRILNSTDVAKISLTGKIEELKQQDYNGKRIHVMITDSDGYTLNSKIDLGVHKHLEVEQEEFCFDLGMSEDAVTLLINSKEQMLTEKLRSILKFGSFSTRYKDIFDIYYLFNCIDKKKLAKCFETLIFNDHGMKENTILDIFNRVEQTFQNQKYIRNLKTSENNWIGKSVDEVLDTILYKLKEMED